MDASRRAVDLANLQYREGTVDCVRVLNTQQTLLSEQDRLVSARGSVTFNVVSLCKALGGGWELRTGDDFVPEEIRERMRERTNWGGLLTTEKRDQGLEAAATGTEGEEGWWRWRWWWPS